MRQSEFHVVRGTEGSTGALGMCRVADTVPRVKCRLSQTKSSNGTHKRHVTTHDWREIQGDKGNPRSQWGIDMWQKELSKLDFRPNNSGGRQKGRKERKKGEKKKS